MKDIKEYEDDDGRTIVDMRGVEKMPLFGSLVPPSRRELEKPEEKKEPWKDTSFKKGTGKASREKRTMA